jgi:hypothetical protein
MNIDTPSSLNYTLSAMDAMTLKGQWADVKYNLNGWYDIDSTGVPEGSVNYNVTVKTFIALSPQINGLDGTIGLAPVLTITEM